MCKNLLTGYHHPTYAASLSEFGTPCELPLSKGFILKRSIPGFSYFDGTGCYPFFTCSNWTNLSSDLQELDKQLVSLSLVTDPFGNFTMSDLHQCFPDRMIPFKEHFIIDLSLSCHDFVSNHHHRYARKALNTVQVELCKDPKLYLDNWLELYSNLIERHNIKGIAAFSKNSFERQLHVPGLVSFIAFYDDKTVGMLLWYVQNEIGYYHLGAYSDLGYDYYASFALFWFAIEYFSKIGLKWLGLGAGAGVRNCTKDGLRQFKREWSTDTRTTFLCGRIFDRVKYDHIIKSKKISANDYFPAYRLGEFV